MISFLTNQLAVFSRAVTHLCACDTNKQAYIVKFKQRIFSRTERILHNKRKLHGHLEIRNFSSRVVKYFTSERDERVKIFFNTRREISYLRAAV